MFLEFLNTCADKVTPLGICEDYFIFNACDVLAEIIFNVLSEICNI